MKIKKWECFLAAFLIILLCTQFIIIEITSDQEELSDKLIRMHIIANSDSEEDQMLKLKVRDAVNDYFSLCLSECKNKNDAADIITDNYDKIEAVVKNTIDSYGAGYDVSVSLSDEYYPTRHYDEFSLPAGKYTSLQIKLGDADGKNWWCVVFPPLCTASIMDTELADVGLTDEEIAFIKIDSDGTVFKFKVLELISLLKEKI